MQIFISAGEPSGDLHGANLIRAFNEHYSEIGCVGFGGDKMEAAGCRLLYPLTRLAVMGFLPVLGLAKQFLELLSRTDRYFRHHRPDAVVLIDFPGFNWWVARRAHFHGIPVFYFVPPQLWAWAEWRVKKMRRFVDHVLCNLPFEESWYQSRGVDAHYVGHPYFDELSKQRLDANFVAAQERRSGHVIGLLPGSRNQEINSNLSTLIRSAAAIHAQRADTRFLVACVKDAHRKQVDEYLKSKNLPVESLCGRTPEIIHLAHSCVAVSGSVGLELLYWEKPTAVLYRIAGWEMQLCRLLKNSRYISLVNLLADRELYPEFFSSRCQAAGISKQILTWFNDPGVYQSLRADLASLRSRVAQPGACQAAARYILHALSRPNRLVTAA